MLATSDSRAPQLYFLRSGSYRNISRAYVSASTLAGSLRSLAISMNLVAVAEVSAGRRMLSEEDHGNNENESRKGFGIRRVESVRASRP